MPRTVAYDWSTHIFTPQWLPMRPRHIHAGQEFRQTCTFRTSYEPHNNVATLLAYIRLRPKGDLTDHRGLVPLGLAPFT